MKAHTGSTITHSKNVAAPLLRRMGAGTTATTATREIYRCLRQRVSTQLEQLNNEKMVMPTPFSWNKSQDDFLDNCIFDSSRL